jgi:WD40 repeat protein
VCFHPKEDRYFLTGGFDKKIRVWNIPNGRVAGWAPTPNAITACRYHLDGNSIAAGILDGRVFIYTIPQTNEPNKLKLSYHTQITTKQKVKKQGKKVTGLSFLQNLSDDKVVGEPKSPHAKRKSTLSNAVKYMKNVRKKKKAQQQLLVTTNDSRLRLVGLKDFCMVRKYKGHSNTSLQIKARFSESGEFIICGSETKGACVIWNTATRRNPLNVNVTGLKMYDKVKGNEWFQATETQIVTDAMFFPSASCKTSILNSGLFPTIHSLTNINHDFSAAAILTCDYEGSIRVFMRKSCFDQVSHAAGPSGYLTP